MRATNKELSEAEELEAHRILNNLSSVPTWTTRTHLRIARALLNHETTFCQGMLRRIVCKRAGLGLYDVSTKELP